MQQEDIQQISNLLDKKFEENNKVLKEEIVDEIGVIFSQSFNELEAKIDSIDEKFNLVVNKGNKIIKKQQDFEVELAANLDAHDRMAGRIGNHEVRIKNLELPA